MNRSARGACFYIHEISYILVNPARYYHPGYEIKAMPIGPIRDDAIRKCNGHAGKGKQIFAGALIQIQACAAFRNPTSRFSQLACNPQPANNSCRP